MLDRFSFTGSAYVIMLDKGGKMVVLKFLFVVLLCFPIAVIGFYSIRDAAKTKNNFKNDRE